MAGVRIQHDTERNCTFTLVDGNRPYRVPYLCPVCYQTHLFKTYHISLDETGAGIVAPEVVDRLARIPGNPFRVVNEVKNPPPILIGKEGIIRPAKLRGDISKE